MDSDNSSNFWFLEYTKYNLNEDFTLIMQMSTELCFVGSLVVSSGYQLWLGIQLK